METIQIAVDKVKISYPMFQKEEGYSLSRDFLKVLNSLSKLKNEPILLEAHGVRYRCFDPKQLARLMEFRMNKYDHFSFSGMADVLHKM